MKKVITVLLCIALLIISLTSFSASAEITNDDLSKMVDTSDEWISTRTGIKSRHIAAENEVSSDLALNALEMAMKNANITKDDLDKTKGNRENFEKAFCEASASNIKIAYSNECFELWFLLHFEDVDATEPLPRKSIYKRLEDAIKRKVDPDFEYEHGDTSIVDIIWQNGDQKEAIIRAKGLNKHHSGHQTEPIDANPNTLVYKLVEELESWYAYYVY